MEILPMRMHRSRRFTLIELLVVVSIIAVLAAMLLSAMRKGKARGDNAKCVNNLRQLGTAMISYADENDEHLIPAVNSWNWAYWIGAGTGGFGLNNGYHIPDRYPKMALCPTNRLAVAADYAPVKYGVNIEISPLSVPAVEPSVRLSRCLFPQRTITIMDASANTSDPAVSRSAFADVGSAGYWHNGNRANLVALDGHADDVRRADSSSPNAWDQHYDAADYTFTFE
jgi:prepilin-type N-terminal cleavage/methylation domain-containing protein